MTRHNNLVAVLRLQEEHCELVQQLTMILGVCSSDYANSVGQLRNKVLQPFEMILEEREPATEVIKARRRLSTRIVSSG